MSETLTQEQVETTAVQVPVANPFSETSWTDQPVTTPQGTVEGQEGTSQAPVQETKQETQKEEDVVYDEKDWLKERFGWETAEDGKRELEELRQLRNNPQQNEIQFANEASQKFFESLKEGKEDEVFAYLNAKRELSALDKLKSDEVIRMNIRYSNPHFKAEDIQDVFEERYSVPTKPIQGQDEEDGEFEIRQQAWQQQYDKVTRRIERDAFTAKQDLAKYNSELVLPDIPQKQESAKAPQVDPQEIERFNQYKGHVIQKLESDLKGFNGINVTYKDEAVEIPIAYTVSEDDKKTLAKFVTNEILGENFNVNDFFGKRWFDETGNPKPQIFEDALFFKEGGKVYQKLVNESATKRMDQKFKEASNIKITPESQGTYTPGAGKSEFDNLAAQVWGG